MQKGEEHLMGPGGVQLPICSTQEAEDGWLARAPSTGQGVTSRGGLWPRQRALDEGLAEAQRCRDSPEPGSGNTWGQWLRDRRDGRGGAWV